MSTFLLVVVGVVCLLGVWGHGIRLAVRKRDFEWETQIKWIEWEAREMVGKDEARWMIERASNAYLAERLSGNDRPQPFLRTSPTETRELTQADIDEMSRRKRTPVRL